MRKIGSFETPEQAETFRTILLGQKIFTRSAEDDPLSVWVIEDDHLDQAMQLFEQFLVGKDDHIQKLLETGLKIKQEHFAAIKRIQFDKGRQTIKKFATSNFPISYGMIGICVVIFLLSFFRPFQIIHYILMFPRVYHFTDIPLWQYWRIITPIFLHGGIFHILFNMMWVYSIGPLIESRMSAKAMIFFIAVAAFFSNTAFFLISGPNFLGLSGIIYAFIGFLWSNDRVSRRPMLTLDDGTFKFFVIWYVICWILSGLTIIPVANTIHGVGGFIGIIFGFFSGGEWRKIPVKQAFDKNSLYTLGIIFALMIGGVIVDLSVY